MEEKELYKRWVQKRAGKNRWEKINSREDDEEHR